MITALLLSAHREPTDQLRAILEEYATVLDVDPREASLALPGNISVDVTFIVLEHVTEKVMAALAEVQALHPESLTVCVASEESAERGRAERSLSPDYWIIAPTSDLQLRTHVKAITTIIRAERRPSSILPSPSPERRGSALVIPGPAHGGVPETVLHRTIGRMTGSSNTEQLLAAYCDAVQELAQCVSYCLLWLEPGAARFEVARAQGLPPLLGEICHPTPDAPLPNWLQRRRGIVIRDALLGDPEGGAVLRQLELCGGVLAVPLFCQGLLRGIMIVGPKAIGTPYLAGDAETLFMLSANAAAAARQIELHRELANRNDYIDQVLSTMESGVVTIDLDGRLWMCNPYAARVLRMESEDVAGRDLRELPSPLGDHLFACLRYGEERTREEITIYGGETSLRISTRRLSIPPGSLLGSMLLLEDMTAERALAEERRKVERSEVISQVVARFAHEIKNPLATIHTFAELLPTHTQDPEFRQFWSEHVKRDVHRLDDLVAKLVSLSEPPAVDAEAAEIPELLRLAMQRVAALDDNAAARIKSDLGADLPTVYVDPSVVSAAIAHLLRFGLGPRHLPITVEAQIANGAPGRQSITILIHTQDDKRSGEEPQELLNPAYVLDHPDIDLGPSASQRLIESQGGTLTVSREGDEIVFRVSLITAKRAVKAGTPEE